MKLSKTNKQIILLILAASILTPSFIILANTQLTIFSPFVISDFSYEVYTEANQPLYQFTGIGLPQVYFDSGDQYPGISIAHSAPFITNYDGNVVLTLEEAANDSATIDEVKFVGNETLKILQTFTIGFDIMIRTHAKFSINYETYLVDNLVGVAVGGVNDAFSVYDAIQDDAKLPFGTLYAQICTSKAGWGDGKQTNLFGPQQVGFSKSLIKNPLHEERGDWRSIDDDDIATDEYDYLSNHFGNKRVLVKPTVDFDVTNTIIEYDYYIPAESEGDKIQVITNQTQMGIYDVRQSNFRQYGLMDQFQPQIDYEITYDTATSNEDDGFNDALLGDENSPWNQDFSDESLRTVYFKYANERRDEILPFNNYILPNTYLETDISPQSFNIDNFQLPITAYMSPYAYLQPQTTVKRADFDSVAFHRLKCITEQYATYVPKTYTDIPYGIKISNAYAIVRILVDIVALSDNKIVYIPIVGDPIDVTDLDDFGLDEFGLTPDNVEVGGIIKDTIIDFDFAMFSYIMGIIIAIGIIVVVIIFLVIVGPKLGKRR